MKRSYMIKQIVEILNKTVLETNECIAERILIKMERLGIYPPSKEIPDPEFPEPANFKWEREDHE